jgi:hypothetical protein
MVRAPAILYSISLLTDYDLGVMIDYRGPIELVQNFRW